MTGPGLAPSQLEARVRMYAVVPPEYMYLPPVPLVYTYKVGLLVLLLLPLADSSASKRSAYLLLGKLVSLDLFQPPVCLLRLLVTHACGLFCTVLSILRRLAHDQR